MRAVAVDEGDPPGIAVLLRQYLAPAPGRLANTVRVVALVLLTVAISETLRMPETALSAYIVLFVSKADRHATVMTAAVAGLAVAAAVLVTVAVFMASLSEPALRLPLIAVMTFLTMFASRASPLGPALFPAGFVVAYGLTLGDSALGLSLQPGGVSNTTAMGLPELAFMPPEDALVRFLLWLAAAVGLPVALVIVANLLTGSDPALLPRHPHATDAPPAGPSQASAAPKQAAPEHGLFVPDAFTDPGHYRFALKSTLAVLLCYAVESLADWPGIHTCIITCFFVSLATVGESLHKAALRIVGCLIGAALAIVAIIGLMPLMEDLGQLLLLLAPVTFVAGWIGFGSERIAYAGFQIGLAFFLAILQGYGPTLDMETAKDRIIGILLGNVAVAVIFTLVWPVRVADVVRPAVAQALEQLAAMLDLQSRPAADAEAAEPVLRLGFEAAIARAGAVLSNERYETLPRRRGVDAAVIRQLRALMVPLSGLLGLSRDPAWAEAPDAGRAAALAYHAQLAAWLRRCARWARTGQGGEVADQLPPPPVSALLASADPHLAARAEWYRALAADLRAILDRVAPATA